MNLRDYVISIIRTVVPVVVGFLISLAAMAGITIDSEALELVISGLFVGGYYALVRLLEAKFPAVGILLGWVSQPEYVKR